jgi:hypothetical protein
VPKTPTIARFIQPMECLSVEKIPEGCAWTYELKLDGYRVIAVKGSGKLTLNSRRGTAFDVLIRCGENLTRQPLSKPIRFEVERLSVINENHATAARAHCQRA